MADFDEQGRLYVAGSAGLNLPRAELEKKLPNFVRRLEDTDGDGVFDKATMFADRMTFPQGCLWHDGSLYVASSGAIWRLTDADDDGVAERREKLVGDFGYTGNAADVHGCFLGPEGRIYWCDGRHGHEIEDATGKLVSRGRAARIFSCRPDGSDVRSFCTGGMDNPVEVVFTPAGDMLGTVNLMYARPRGDCLVHWQYGSVYPREDFAASFDREMLRTGDLLTEVHNFGHVALSGLCRYRGGQFGDSSRGALFITQFNTRRVVRVGLKRAGSTYRLTSQEDFAVSPDEDFHPTDVLEDADGSLLVIDTGGWFRIGCPQSQVAKPDISGAIYRIRKIDAAAPDDPRGQEIDWKAAPPARLAELLNDPRWAVRDRAMNALARRAAASPEEVRGALSKALAGDDPAARRRVVKTAARVDQPWGRELIARALEDSDATVRQTAARMLYFAPPPEDALQTRLVELLRDDAPAVRRAAAVALGRSAAPAPRATAALLDALGDQQNGRQVRHALAYALIEIGDRAATASGLLSQNVATRETAALVLEQMRQKANPARDAPWLEIPAPALGAPLNDEQRKKLLTVEDSLSAGDAARGRAVFYSEKAACAKCHRAKGRGGQIGPDLTTIGRIRARRDLLESILFPSASFARGFEPYTILTTDGRSLSGILLAETATELRVGIDKENPAAIPVADIEAMRASPTSIMPQDVARQLSPTELADLLAYLQSLQ
jgi:putative membrane-bound dehydrogenase-like protein